MEKHRATPSCTLITVFPGTFFSKRLGQLVLLAAIFMVPFLTSAQSWDTVRIVDFSNPSFTDSLTGVQGFAQQGFGRGNNGASGNFNDLCAFTSSFSAQDRMRMRVSLLAGVTYRVSLNGKVNRTGQAVNFGYVPTSNPQQVTFISQGVPLADIHYEDPGAAVESDTFSVAADGNYWVAVEHGGVNLPNVFARLDNFMVEALQEAPMPSLSLTDNDGNPITSSIEAEPGTPFMLCLSPDSAPAEDMALALSIDGDGSPHFSDFTTMPLTFPAGSTDNVCFELSPSAEAVAGTYTFQLTDGNGEEVMSFEVGVEPPCTSVAGPGHIICAGETVQLGTGCLPAPHPVDGVEYCYAWEPADGLDHPASAMPNATPSETTTYTVYVTTSEGELIPEESVVVTVEDFVAEILPAAPSLCYREPVMLRQGSMPNACENDFVTLSVSGSYASATWSTGSTADSITVFDPGLYSVTVTSANGCEAVDEVEVEMCTATPLGITASIPQLCEDTVMLSVDTAFMSYTWSDGSGLSALQVVDTGTYSVTVEDLNGCIGVDSVTIGVCSPLVDIDIYNGFYDWASNASWSGGQMVMESGDEEFVKGAVTVANRNDTDGDGTIDYEDMNVVASQVGRNEIDLMKLEIHEPVPYVGGDMKIAILQGADRIRLWSSPTKVDSLTRNSNNEYFIDFSALSNSTVELYVEALDHSVSSNDIVVEASYKDKTDRVSATAFWVEMNMVYPNTTGSPQLISPQPSSESTCGNCLPQQNPAPNPLVVLDNCTMYSGINCRWIAKNMTRYGFGPSRSGTIPPISATLNCPNMNFPGDITNNNKWIGGRVFWEFEILPKLHQSVYTSLDLYFDITRQRKTNTRKIISGKGDFDGQLEKFPWENQEDNEQPNDDSGRSNALGQNDNTPSQNGMIYSFDPPGSNIYDLCNENVAFVVYRATFQEFVRMRINKFDTNQPMGPPNNLEGSRLSSKLNWYTVFQLIRSSNNFYKMELDTLDQSVSIPVKVSNSNSNGSVSTSILNPGIVATNGYELIFDKANRSWSVSKFDGTSYTNTQVLQESSQGFWDTQASGYEGVSISILEGSIPFVTNERYLFSTFSTQNSQGKVNGMGIVPQPFQVDSPF